MSSWMTPDILAKCTAVGACGVGVALGMWAQRASDHLPLTRVRAAARRLLRKF